MREGNRNRASLGEHVILTANGLSLIPEFYLLANQTKNLFEKPSFENWFDFSLASLATLGTGALFYYLSRYFRVERQQRRARGEE